MRTQNLMVAILCALSVGCSSTGGSKVCDSDTDCRGGEICDQRKSLCISVHLDGSAPLTDLSVSASDLGGLDALGGHADLAAASTDWARSIAGDKADQIQQVRFTSDGGIVAGGTFIDRAVVGGDSVLSVGDRDLLLVRYSASGAVLWKRAFGGTEMDNFYSIALAPDDSVIVAGLVRGPVDFGLGMTVPIGRYDFFIAKYAATGTPIWVKRFGGSGGVFAQVLIDTDGSLVTAGFFSDSVDFGNGPLTASAMNNTFMARYSASGQLLNVRKLGSSGSTASWFALLPSGELALTGTFQGTEDFGTGRISSAGGIDCFLLKLKSTGEPIWARTFGGPGQDICNSVGSDASGNLFTAGSFTLTADFNGGPLTSDDNDDGFVAKYGPTGNGLWARRIGGRGADSVRALAVAADGSVLAGGSFSDKLPFGPTTPVALGGSDGFVALFAADGTPVRARGLGSRSPDYVFSVDTRPGRVAVGGTFYGDIDFITDKFSAADLDGYVLSLSSSRL